MVTNVSEKEEVERQGRKIIRGILVMLIGFASMAAIIYGYVFVSHAMAIPITESGPVIVSGFAIVPGILISVLGVYTIPKRYKTSEEERTSYRLNVLLGILLLILVSLIIWFDISA
ncbi:MAG TPA: hypothetical protein VKM55_01725 [Candidatus Lokiarchaeia archaeon]|nr:hypothetical protein [Candidatus Lokiarchaeia archaeon]